jgi:hypothetical protein
VFCENIDVFNWSLEHLWKGPKGVAKVAGEAADLTDPETVIFSCPEWLLYAGWDRGQNRTLGLMRQEARWGREPSKLGFSYGAAIEYF